MRGRLLSGRYRLSEALGAGGMGAVWRARDEALGRDVAVKVFRPPPSGTDDNEDRTELLARFRQEARAAAALDSPYIVAVHDFGTDGELPYLVMAVVNGRSLEQILHTEGRLPLYRALEWAEQICRALTTAHDAGVVHRDIKPGNVMVTDDDNTVKVLDFGIAKFLDADETTNRLTRTGQMPMGTVLYMAPEQFTGAPSDGRLDLYALGCVLYELLIGRPPYTGHAAGVMYNHLHDTPLRPTRARTELPPAIDRLILDLMAHDPAHRPADAAEVTERLRHIADEHTSDSLAPAGTPAAGPEPRALPGPTLEPAHDPATTSESAPPAVPEDTPPTEPEDTPPAREPVPVGPEPLTSSDGPPFVHRGATGRLPARVVRRRRTWAKAAAAVAVPVVTIAALSFSGAGSPPAGGGVGDSHHPAVLTTSGEKSTALLRRVLKASGSPGPKDLRVVTAELGMNAERDRKWAELEEEYPKIVGHLGTQPRHSGPPFPAVYGEGRGHQGVHYMVPNRAAQAERLLAYLRATHGLTSLLHLGAEPHQSGGLLTHALAQQVEREKAPVRFLAAGPDEGREEVDRARVRTLVARHDPQVAVLPRQDGPRAEDPAKRTAGERYSAKELRADGFKGIILTEDSASGLDLRSSGAGTETEAPEGAFRVRDFADSTAVEECALGRELCAIAEEMAERHEPLEDFDAMLAVADAVRNVKEGMSVERAQEAFQKGLFTEEDGLLGPLGLDREALKAADSSAKVDDLTGHHRPFWLDRSVDGRWKEHTRL